MNRNETLAAVFDCMIYLQASFSAKSPAAELFRQVERGNVVLYVSDEILAEIRDVLTRPRALVKYPHLTDEYVEEFLDRVLKKTRIVNKISNHFQL